MDLGNGLGHLTYSTLVHPADNWEQLWDSVQTYLPKVKARVSPDEPFGVCLRLAAPTAEVLAANPRERQKLKAYLDDNDMYVYTANAFPYGAFKGTVVKEQVYEPDWRTEERTTYTINVADILADLCSKGISPSIQTAPLGFKPNVTGPDVVDSYTEHVLRVAAHLVEHRSPDRPPVTLGLEPEPRCFLETTDETVEYFTTHLYTGKSAARLSKLAGIPMDSAIGALRRHLGVVFDIGHQAVGFEDIPMSLQKLVDAGIPIVKLQEAAAMNIPKVTAEKVEALKRFAKTVYLSQTVEQKNGQRHALPESRGRLRRLECRSGRARLAHALPRPDFPGRPRPAARHDAVCAGTGADDAQGDAAVAAARDRNLHLGRAARPPQNRRHRGLRLPRNRVGESDSCCSRRRLPLR